MGSGGGVAPLSLSRYWAIRLLFEEGSAPVRQNKVASYLWYCLAAAQGLQIADRARERILSSDLTATRLDEGDRNDVYLKFIEVYLNGGQEAQFRLGQILDSPFFLFSTHDQDQYHETNSREPQLRFVHAYAAYSLAIQGEDRNLSRRAMEARRDLVERQDFNAPFGQEQGELGEALAKNWAKAIGMDPDPSNPFTFTPSRVASALSRGSEFQRSRADLVENDQSRSWLLTAKAFQARGDVRNSKIAFETAIQIDPNSRAALEAQQQLQQLSTTCSATSYADPEERQRQMAALQSQIAPAHVQYGADNPLSRVRQISIAAQQRALRALGFYEGAVDNSVGRMTREGYRQFLASLNLDRRDFLNAPQIVELICQAAQLRKDPSSQNMLGVMYAKGIGVEKNPDLAHHYFGEAARQNEPSAIYNMGMMYAKEEGLPFKNHPQSCSIACGYLREALALKHPRARAALNKLRSEPACRGRAIAGCTTGEGDGA